MENHRYVAFSHFIQKLNQLDVILNVYLQNYQLCAPVWTLGGGGQLAYVVIRGCAIILDTCLGVAPGFLGIIFW